MKSFIKKEGGFTLIELLVVILIIGILIAVAAPSFLGQTEKANASAAKQYNAVAYKAAKAFAVDNPAGQNSFTGFSTGALTAIEPGSPVTVVSASDTSVTLQNTVGDQTCTLVAPNAGALPAQTCS